MCANQAESATTWVPTCCQTPMRYNVFQGSDSALAATLVCVTCGKHFTLQPHVSGSFDQYGEGTHMLHVIGIPRPARKKGAVASPENPETTL
jgi:hypothetical protein